jgi:hypothetical protein
MAGRTASNSAAFGSITSSRLVQLGGASLASAGAFDWRPSRERLSFYAMLSAAAGIALALLSASPLPRPAPAPSLLEKLAQLPGSPRRDVLRLALEARDCAHEKGVGRGDLLALVDYSLPSTERRFWVLDLEQPRILFRELVAHGRGSGENLATSFSNTPQSRKSSLGLFVTGDEYSGGHGLSLRLRGLEPGVNDAAFAREIVIHPAPYVTEAFGQAHARLGRSWGCLALSPAIARRVIERLGRGTLVWAYYPDARWLQSSSYLRCRG